MNDEEEATYFKYRDELAKTMEYFMHKDDFDFPIMCTAVTACLAALCEAGGLTHQSILSALSASFDCIEENKPCLN